jgi:transposase
VRRKRLEFFAAQAPCVVRDGSLRRFALRSASWDNTVRLIPPAYVKPFVKRQKNDVADAEAICEAAQRPNMRFVPLSR